MRPISFFRTRPVPPEAGQNRPSSQPTVYGRRIAFTARLQVARIGDVVTQNNDNDPEVNSGYPAPLSEGYDSSAVTNGAYSNGNGNGSKGASVYDQPKASSSISAEFSSARGDETSGRLPVSVHRLEGQASVAAAITSMRSALEALHTAPSTAAQGGLIRWEVPLPRHVQALDFLRGQARPGVTGPRVYFSPRKFASPGGEGSTQAEECTVGVGSAAGVGAAWMWQGEPGKPFNDAHLHTLHRFLSPDHAQVRVFGALRFHPDGTPSDEWAAFGPYIFLLPLLECQELPACTLLSLQVAWDDGAGKTFEEAKRAALTVLGEVRQPVLGGSSRLPVTPLGHTHLPELDQWLDQVANLRDSLSTPSLSDSVVVCAPPPAASAPSFPDTEDYEGSERRATSTAASTSTSCTNQMTKVVLARRTDFELRGRPDPLELLTALQERDPRAYQLLIELPGGPCFLGSTPERLYIRSGDKVATEAVAGTRPRGAPGDEASDARYAQDLLTSAKEHAEFVVVRDWIEHKLQQICGSVEVEKPKTLLRQEAVQHLYGRLAGTLESGRTDADLLKALHPTPAVCGQPREGALERLLELEPFDRGLYSGPFGWISGNAAEFIVAIRSALVHPAAAAPSPSDTHKVSLYAGVGIVQGADPHSEWQELNLKIRQFDKLLQGPPSLRDLPNVNSLWAHLLIEELCRLGVSTFCVAPGSRSSPLSVAAASHPRARVVMCIDERSLGFYALGHSKGKGRPCAIITSSGTAVANLLPAVVEASQSNVPLVVLTADRPPEVRDTGSNQTIDQVKIFGAYVRWECDLHAPDGATKARVVLSAADTAVRRALGPIPGPVHLNFPCREPLAPTPEPWSPSVLEGLGRWEQDQRPFTAPITGPSASSINSSPLAEVQDDLLDVLHKVKATTRGMIVVAGLNEHRDVAAAAALARALNWPVVADATSGLRVFGQRDDSVPLPTLLPAFDHMLLTRDTWEALQPEVVLQLGTFLTSKRISQFLSWASLRDGPTAASWFYVSPLAARHDPSHALSAHIGMDVPAFVQLVLNAVQAPPQPSPFLSLALQLNNAAAHAIHAAFPATPTDDTQILTEPMVARAVAENLPPGHALYLGNSMPIRDMDMYAGVGTMPHPDPSKLLDGEVGVGVPVGASRGASGIDGVSSAAIGYAEGLGRPVTLLIGDVSFLHDTNGLTLLRGGQGRPPVTIVLVNNGGGGIFSFLPIANAIPSEVFEPVFATPPGVSFPDISRAHAITHHVVRTPLELNAALQSAWASQQHAIVEVLVPDRQENFAIHQRVQAAAKAALATVLTQQQAQGRGSSPSSTSSSACNAGERKGERQASSSHAQRLFCGSSMDRRRRFGTGGPSNRRTSVRVRATADTTPAAAASDIERALVITSVTVHPYALPLRRPLTTRDPALTRHGAILCVRGQVGQAQGEGDELEASFLVGVGECAPLPGLHQEHFHEALSQLTFLGEQLQGCVITAEQAQSATALDYWLWNTVAVSATDLYPSVRSCLESALSNLVAPSTPATSQGEGEAGESVVEINGLVDGVGASETTMAEALRLVQRGYRTLKIKVGRIGSPVGDAQSIASICTAIQAAAPDLGVKLRADANRLWDLPMAQAFADELKAMGVTESMLEYIEEPCRTLSDTKELALRNPELRVALDETLDDIIRSAPSWPEALATIGRTATSFPAAALVVKPAIVGGVLRCKDIAAIGVPVIISSSFESPVGLLSYLDIAHTVSPTRAHGLGTLSWFQLTDRRPSDPSLHAINVTVGDASAADPQVTAKAEALTKVIADVAHKFGNLNPTTPLAQSLPILAEAALSLSALNKGMSTADLSCSVKVDTPFGPYEMHGVEYFPYGAPPAGAQTPSVVFLHGFTGDCGDFHSFARALSLVGIRCVCVDLPGHGRSRVIAVDGSERTPEDDEVTTVNLVDKRYSVEAATFAVKGYIRKTLEGPISLVGYSLGGRVALASALADPGWARDQLASVMIISSSPGLEEDGVRKARRDADDHTALALAKTSLSEFLPSWYSGTFWESLRTHPAYERLLQARTDRTPDIDDPRLTRRLAHSLSSMSPGRMLNLWDFLPEGSLRGVPSYWVAGVQDEKFRGVTRRAVELLNAPVSAGSPNQAKSSGSHSTPVRIVRVAGANAVPVPKRPVSRVGSQVSSTMSCAIAVEVEAAGHAVHLERPLAILQLLVNLLWRSAEHGDSDGPSGGVGQGNSVR